MRKEFKDLTPIGQRYFLDKTRPQFIFWSLVILAMCAGVVYILLR